MRRLCAVFFFWLIGLKAATVFNRLKDAMFLAIERRTGPRIGETIAPLDGHLAPRRLKKSACMIRKISHNDLTMVRS